MFADLLLGTAYRGEPSDLDMLGHLRAARDAMMAGVPVPAESARYLASGLDRFLSGRCGDLTQALGLRPRRGRKNPVTRECYVQRDLDVEKLCDELLKRCPPRGYKGKLIAQAVDGALGNDVPEIRELAARIRAASGDKTLSPRRYALILQGRALTSDR